MHEFLDLSLRTQAFILYFTYAYAIPVILLHLSRTKDLLCLLICRGQRVKRDFDNKGKGAIQVYKTVVCTCEPKLPYSLSLSLS